MMDRRASKASGSRSQRLECPNPDENSLVRFEVSFTSAWRVTAQNPEDS